MKASTLIGAILLIAPWASGARGDVTIDEALETVRRTMGSDLEVIRTRQTGRYYPKYRFFARPEGRRLSVSVDKHTGRLESYTRPTPLWPGKAEGTPAPSVMSVQEAERIAVAEALRLMGEDYSRLGPSKRSLDPEYNTVDIYWPQQLVGDPPRGGVTPGCTVKVSLVDGGIVSFSSRVPECSDPIPPKVTADEAVEAARKHLDDATATPARAPSLIQNQYGPGTLHWYVKLATAPPPPTRVVKADGTVEEVHISGAGLHLITVDALTGEVVGDSQAGGTEAIPPGESEEPTPLPSTASVIPSPEPAPNAGGTPAVPVVPLAGAGVVLVLAAAAVVVVRRRR